MANPQRPLSKRMGGLKGPCVYSEAPRRQDSFEQLPRRMRPEQRPGGHKESGIVPHTTVQSPYVHWPCKRRAAICAHGPPKKLASQCAGLGALLVWKTGIGMPPRQPLSRAHRRGGNDTSRDAPYAGYSAKALLGQPGGNGFVRRSPSGQNMPRNAQQSRFERCLSTTPF